MELSLRQALTRLRETNNVMNNKPQVTTGPGALKTGFINFMSNQSDGYISAGTYIGVEGRSVTAIGSKSFPQEYIRRIGLGEFAKKRYYKALGIDHFFVSHGVPNQGAVSCMDHLKRSEGTNKVANYVHDGQKYVDSN